MKFYIANLINPLLRLVFTGTFKKRPCDHLQSVDLGMAGETVCLDCVALGDTWPDLRVCLTCGYTGCCEQGKNQHALNHWRETGHPLVRPYRAGLIKHWLWCYEDQALIDFAHPGKGVG